MVRLSFGLIILLLTACEHTYQVVPSPSVVGAEGSPDKEINYTVSYYIDPKLALLTQNATAEVQCSAHQYPVNAGPAIASLIRSVNETVFKHSAEGGTIDRPVSGAQRHLVYSLESFAPRLVDTVQDYGGMFSGAAAATVDLAIAVIAYDGSGKQVFRTTVSGSGQAAEDTGLFEGKFCGGAADALKAATDQAIKQAMTNYVDRIVNTEWF